MSEGAFHDAVQSVANARKRFEGLPVEGALAIARECVERIALTPEAAQWEAAGIGALDGAAGLLLTSLGVTAIVAPLAVKLLDYALHAALALAKRESEAHLASERLKGTLGP